MDCEPEMEWERDQNDGWSEVSVRVRLACKLHGHLWQGHWRGHRWDLGGTEQLLQDIVDEQWEQHTKLVAMDPSPPPPQPKNPTIALRTYRRKFG